MGVGDYGNDPYAPPVRPRVRFSAIGEGWELFKARTGMWVLTGLIVVIGYWAISAAMVALFGKGAVLRGGGFRFALPPEGRALTAALNAVFTGFFLGGMFRMACLQVRGRRVEVGDLFSVSDVLPDLALGSLLYALVVFAGGLLCFVPGLIAAGVLMFTIPLIVDGRLTAAEAVRQSWHALKGEWLTVTVFHFVAYVLAGSGACCCFFGLLLTMPLYCLSIAVLYRDFFLAKGATGFTKPAAPYPEF